MLEQSEDGRGGVMTVRSMRSTVMIAQGRNIAWRKRIKEYGLREKRKVLWENKDREPRKTGLGIVRIHDGKEVKDNRWISQSNSGDPFSGEVKRMGTMGGG